MPAKLSPSNNSDSYKIVLFGPPGAGKCTNLKAIEQALAKSTSSSPASEADQPAPAEAHSQLNLEAGRSFRVPLNLCTLAADVDSTWMTTMRGMHGLIFVADSDPERYDENINAMANLIGKLAYFRIKIDHFPVVVQYNKRDLEGATPLSRLEEGLNPLGLPAFSAVAKDGIGACECIKAINLLIEKRHAQS